MNERTPPAIVMPAPEAETVPIAQEPQAEAPARPRLDPTRYGDWELNGKCVDF